MHIANRIDVNTPATGKTADTIVMISMIEHSWKIPVLGRIIYCKKNFIEMLEMRFMKQHILSTVIAHVFGLQCLHKLHSQFFCKMHVGQKAVAVDKMFGGANA